MKQFTRIEPTTIYQVGDKFKNDVVIKRFRTEDGIEHEFTTFYNETIVAPQVVALTPENKVIMVYQFRAGPEKWLYDFPGGASEKHERAEETAQRELLEETGYVVDAIEYIGECHASAYENLPLLTYIATGCRYTSSNHRIDSTEVQQGAEVRLVDIDELFDIARRGELCYVASLMIAEPYLRKIMAKNAIQREGGVS